MIDVKMRLKIADLEARCDRAKKREPRYPDQALVKVEVGIVEKLIETWRRQSG